MRAFQRFHPWVCIFLLALSHHLSSQTPAPVPTTEFSAEPAVITANRTVVTMHADGTGVRDTSVSIRVQTEAAVRQLGVVSAAFAGSAEHAEFVSVKVLHKDGTTTETPVSSALEQPAPVTREAPFYSDLKILQIPVKNLSVGDMLEWHSRLTRTTPEAPGQFWGQENFVRDGIALTQTFELHVPASVHLTLWTNPEVAAPKDSTTGTERTIVWSDSHLVPSVGAAAEAAKKKVLTPEQDLALTKGALPSFAWSTFPTWQAVAAWYQALQADRVRPDPSVSAKVAQLIAGKTSQAEQAQAIYDYVATQIRYIGVAFGIGRYQPHTAAEVLANQYGDCKDKHTLLAAMLSQIGLQPEATLIGAGVRFNAALPSPGAFNHLITHVTVDGKPVWLDTTAEVAPWGTLMPLIRDQQALVVSPTAAHLEQTPATAPFSFFATMAATETLNTELTSEARITVTFHDDDEMALRSLLRQISPSQYPEFIQKFVAGMGYGGTATDPDISRPDDLEHPLTLSYHYKRIKDADWGENRVTEPFWPISLPAVDEKEPPIASIQLGTPRTETSTVEMQLPKGWSAELPEAIHAKAAFATADVTFHLTGGGTVTAERKLVILQPKVAAADWKTYKKWMDDAQVTGYPFIHLFPAGAKSSSGTTAEAADPGAARNGTAERLVTQAGEALRSMDTKTANRLLDEAKELNPKQRMLWAGYAYSAYLLGEISKATEDAHRELAAYPDELQMYGLLADLHQARGEHDAALASLRDWVAAAPDNPAPETALVRELSMLKRPEEAMIEGEGGLHRLSTANADVTQLRLVLADVQAKNGHKQEAAATVLPLKGAVTDPSQQNSVAYILADAQVDLPGDEAAERAVLDQLDEQTASWTLDEARSALVTKTGLLIASWDTMGWILFQENHLPEARSYLAAAWFNDPRSAMEEHLHAIDQALHRTTAEEHGSEQGRRTFALGPSHGQHGSAEVRLLLGEGKVLRAEPDLAHIPKPSASSAFAPLTNATELAKAADVHQLFPQGSKAHMVRQGFVNCSGPTCQLILEPLAVR